MSESTARRSGKRKRVYVRRFDHDEARGRYATGAETISDLAREYGVSYNAVRNAVIPGVLEQQKQYQRMWRVTPCESCGAPTSKATFRRSRLGWDGRLLCKTCRSQLQRTRLRFDEFGQLAAVRCLTKDCANGQQWQPPENFPRGTRYRDVRKGGIHDHCRTCQTRMRRNYRNRHKVPCRACGTPILGESESRRGSKYTGLCLSCWHKQRQQA